MTDTLLSGTAHAIGAFTTMQCPFGQWWRDVVVRRAHAAVRWTAPSGVRPVAVGMVVACWTGWTRCRGRSCATTTGGEGHAGTGARVPGSGRGARGHRRSGEHDLPPGRLGVFGGAPAVLPFLLELAEEPSVTVRVEAIDLVARIASEADRVKPRFLDDGWPPVQRLRRRPDDPGLRIVHCGVLHRAIQRCRQT
jgi:hypothetical protein